MWYHHRRTIVPMFADRFIRQYGETFARLAKLFCDQTLDKASEDNVSVEIHGILSRLTIDAIGTGRAGRAPRGRRVASRPSLTAAASRYCSERRPQASRALAGTSRRSRSTRTTPT